MFRMAEKFMGLAAILVIATGTLSGPAGAETKGLALLELRFTEVQLTSKLIEGFLKGQNELNALGDQAPASDAEERVLQAKIDAISKAAGFTDYIAMDDAAQTIALVYSGIDTKTGSFVEPLEAIRQEINATEADKALPEKVKAALLVELKTELAATPPLKFRGNIALVKSYHARIAAVMR